MRGDFSRLDGKLNTHIRGVLNQQGKVLLDSDWNTQTGAIHAWQDQAGQDVIGAGVLAVPDTGSNSNAFSITQASYDPAAQIPEVQLTIVPGRGWADGVLVGLPGSAPVTRVAKVMSTDGTVPAPGNRDRDVVVMEVWSQEISSFQYPSDLLEPALGGIDTTEQVRVAVDFKILPLAAGQDCTSIALDRQDSGTLQVTFAKTTTQGDKDCPQVVQGGYTGLEHSLYRFEIARTDDTEGGYDPNSALFKYSRFNGGMVGRGIVTRAGNNPVIEVTSNVQAIADASWNSQVLIEILTLADDDGDPDSPPMGGRWKTLYAAKATIDTTQLSTQNQLSINVDSTSVIYGSGNLPAVGDLSKPETFFFFRIWDGVRSVKDFVTNGGVELENGIFLQFGNAGSNRYYPDNFWTVKVRASITSSADSWPNPLPPQGIVYHRVPVAELDWGGLQSISGAAIESCRLPFKPLTELDDCCCIEVKPGDDINKAIQKVKGKLGGCIYLLPGVHKISAPIALTDISDVLIKGEEYSSVLELEAGFPAGSAVFHCERAFHVRFESFSVASRDANVTVWELLSSDGISMSDLKVGLTKDAKVDPSKTSPVVKVLQICSNLSIDRCSFVGGAGFSMADSGQVVHLAVRDCNIVSLDVAVTVFSAYGVEIERCFLVSLNAALQPQDVPNLIADGWQQSPSGSVFVDALDVLTQVFAQAVPATPSAAILFGYCMVSRISENRLFGAFGAYLLSCSGVKVAANAFEASGIGLLTADSWTLDVEENLFAETTNNPCATAIYSFDNSTQLRIVGNRILSAFTGICFQPLGQGEYIGHQDLMGQMLRADTADPARVATFMAGAKLRCDWAVQMFNRWGSVGAVNLCNDVSIRGNDIAVNGNAIALFGAVDVGDFEISGNAFWNCGLGAIDLEPANQNLLVFGNQPMRRSVVDNSFDTSAVLLRSSLNSLLFSRNEASVFDRGAAEDLPGLYAAIAQAVYSSPDLSDDIAYSDAYDLRLIGWGLLSDAAAQAGSMDPTALVKALGSYGSVTEFGSATCTGILGAVVSACASQKRMDLAVALLNQFFWPMVNALDGNLVSLTGLAPRVTGNRLDNTSSKFLRGITLDLLSGEVKDNLVYAPVMALSVAGSLIDPIAQSTPGLQITGNRLDVGQGDVDAGITTTFALWIASVPRGASLLIAHNQLDGNVYVGRGVTSYVLEKSQQKVEAYSQVRSAVKSKAPGYSVPLSNIDYTSIDKLIQNVTGGGVMETPSTTANRPTSVALPTGVPVSTVQFVSNRVTGDEVLIAADYNSKYGGHSKVSSVAFVVFTGNMIFGADGSPSSVRVWSYVSTASSNITLKPMVFKDVLQNPHPTQDPWKVANIPAVQ